MFKSFFLIGNKSVYNNYIIKQVIFMTLLTQIYEKVLSCNEKQKKKKKEEKKNKNGN